MFTSCLYQDICCQEPGKRILPSSSSCWPALISIGYWTEKPEQDLWTRQTGEIFRSLVLFTEHSPSIRLWWKALITSFCTLRYHHNIHVRTVYCALSKVLCTVEHVYSFHAFRKLTQSCSLAASRSRVSSVCCQNYCNFNRVQTQLVNCMRINNNKAYMLNLKFVFCSLL